MPLSSPRRHAGLVQELKVQGFDETQAQQQAWQMTVKPPLDSAAGREVRRPVVLRSTYLALITELVLIPGSPLAKGNTPNTAPIPPQSQTYLSPLFGSEKSGRRGVHSRHGTPGKNGYKGFIHGGIQCGWYGAGYRLPTITGAKRRATNSLYERCDNDGNQHHCREVGGQPCLGVPMSTGKPR